MKKFLLNVFALLLSCGTVFAESHMLIPADVYDIAPGNRSSTAVNRLTDNSPKTWYQGETNRVSIILDYKTPVKPVYYCLTSSGINQLNDPQQWALKGSADGKKWVNVDKRSGFQFYSRFQEAGFEITKPVAYRYFKIELHSPPKSKVTLADISFSESKGSIANWKGFVYPKVNFVDKDNKVNGSQIYHRLVHNPSQFIADHAQKVASILYWTDKDERKDIRTINYELRPDNGISAKGGDAPVIDIFYSADWVEKTATNKGDFDVLYETRGVLYHELTHGYQLEPKGCGQYRIGDEYFAFIEGLADAVRYEAGFFPVTNRRPGGNWMDGYQTTGFFLQWLTTKDPDFIRKFNRSAAELNPWSFDKAMQHILGEGKTTQKLWDEYQEFVKKDIKDRNKHNGVADLVNPLMGTDSKMSSSNGNTYPAIVLPWVMNFWMPQNGKLENG